MEKKNANNKSVFKKHTLNKNQLLQVKGGGTIGQQGDPGPGGGNL